MIEATYAGRAYLDKRATLSFTVEFLHYDKIEVNLIEEENDTESKQETTWLVPEISTISPYGEVLISFNTTMVPMTNIEDTRMLESVNTGLRRSDPEGFHRINNGTIRIEDKYFEVLNVAVIDPNGNDEPTPIDFTWECTDFTESNMTLQLDFVAPNLVSSDDKAHILQLIFYGSTLFKDVSGNMIAPGLTIRKEIPRQIDSSTGEKIEFLG